MGKKRRISQYLSDEIEEILSRPTAPVVRVGRVFFNFGRDATNAAVKRGEIVTKDFGRRKLALTAPLRKLLSPNAK